MDEFEIEIKKDFLQEAKELLENTEQSFLELEKDPSNQTLINSIFRFAHNLKGTSRAVGFGQIAELTHVAENLLLQIKDDKIKVNDSIVSTLLEFNDKVREMIEGLFENVEATFETHEMIQKFETILANGGVVTEVVSGEIEVPAPKAEEFPEEVVEAPAAIEASGEYVNPFPIDEELLAEAMALEAATKAKLAAQEAEKAAQKVQATPAPTSAPVAKPVEAAPSAEKKAAPKKDSKKEDETLRVSVERLEKLNDLVGELVILQALVEGSLSKVGEHKTARSLGKLCKEIQDLSMSLRMVPVGPSFQKLTRIVRDTSKLLNKKVNLQLLGEDTEIDKTVAESLGDPLVHIIRNAIDHGVETPEERVMVGKPEEGVVEVMAFHEGNFLIIQITDDGKGIDGKKLIEKAKSKGIIPASATLTEQQGIELIFHPGFSSKEVVSEVSGRGVGMDVVKTNIEALGGEVKVRSKVGSGSCFRLMLPLTLAIIEGMLIETGGMSFVVPKGQVQEIYKLEENNIHKITGRIPYLTLRKDIVPLFNLDEDLSSSKKSDSKVAIIVPMGDVLFAVGIHDIVRQLQVVVKPPTNEIMGRPGIMGTTILGNGKPALILDLLNLYSKRVKKEAASGGSRPAVA